MSSAKFAPCVVIPVYNHAHLLAQPLARIHQLGLPCVVVNDGGDAEARATLKQLCRSTHSYFCEQYPNGGKGSAVLLGMQHAERLGFTHAVQVDADGQHNIEDIPRFVKISRAAPQQLIAGAPEYDASVPKHRYYSRYLTHIWVWIETLSLDIKDSMCGFRVYPLACTLALARDVRLGGHMDFDTEVLVRLHWRGVAIESVPTRVIYPEQSISNFRLWRDNAAISWMHTRLVMGMLIRLPILLARRFNNKLESPHG